MTGRTKTGRPKYDRLNVKSVLHSGTPVRNTNLSVVCAPYLRSQPQDVDTRQAYLSYSPIPDLQASTVGQNILTAKRARYNLDNLREKAKSLRSLIKEGDMLKMLRAGIWLYISACTSHQHLTLSRPMVKT